MAVYLSRIIHEKAALRTGALPALVADRIYIKSGKGREIFKQTDSAFSGRDVRIWLSLFN